MQDLHLGVLRLAYGVRCVVSVLVNSAASGFWELNSADVFLSRRKLVENPRLKALRMTDSTCSKGPCPCCSARTPGTRSPCTCPQTAAAAAAADSAGCDLKHSRKNTRLPDLLNGLPRDGSRILVKGGPVEF